MSRANQVLALLQSHIVGDDQQFLSVAMQVAAHEAHLGHTKLAEQMRELIDKARKKSSLTEHRGGPVIVLQPKSELGGIIPNRRCASFIVSVRTEGWASFLGTGMRTNL